MGKRKPGLTLERHREIGAELMRVQRLLVSLQVEIKNSYAKNGTEGRIADKIAAAEKRLLQARSSLEDVMVSEVGNEHWDKLRLSEVYFGYLPGESGYLETNQPTPVPPAGQE